MKKENNFAFPTLTSLEFTNKIFTLCVTFFQAAILLLTLHVLTNILYSPTLIVRKSDVDKSAAYTEFVTFYSEKLDSLYSSMIDCVKTSNGIESEAKKYYEETLESSTTEAAKAIICSNTNRAFNKLREQYELFTDLSNNCAEFVLDYEYNYNLWQQYIDLLNSTLETDYPSSAYTPEDISQMLIPMYEREKHVTDIYREAKDISDNLYNECFDETAVLVSFMYADLSSEEIYDVTHNYLRGMAELDLLENTLY